MATRIQSRQRPHAAGKHQRTGQRPVTRENPPDGLPWGQQGWPGGGGGTGVPATGATAGIPGTWTPAGSTPPATVAALIAGTPNAVTASPATAWTAGQYVQTRTAGAAGQATWTGTAWVGGVAPVTAVLSGTIDQVKEYVNGLAMDDQRAVIIQQLVDYERANANRSTLVTWLDQQLGVT